jgi:hypothetical protein
MYLGVRLAGSLVVPLPHDDALRRDDHGPHKGVGTRTTSATLRQLERASHEVRIGQYGLYHFS